MDQQLSLFREMQRRYQRGELSIQEYRIFEEEWRAQLQLRQRVELIEQVAEELIAREDQEDTGERRSVRPIG